MSKNLNNQTVSPQKTRKPRRTLGSSRKSMSSTIWSQYSLESMSTGHQGKKRMNVEWWYLKYSFLNKQSQISWVVVKNSAILRRRITEFLSTKIIAESTCWASISWKNLVDIWLSLLHKKWHVYNVMICNVSLYVYWERTGWINCGISTQWNTM